ncbi:uncharacterized protein ACBR49_018336 [Aulostomus maculatus]
MGGREHLLLLAVSLLLAGCQSKPKVIMSPPLKQIFSGDLFYLKCDNIPSGASVRWYLDNLEQMKTTNPLKFSAADPACTGSYQCDSNGQRSDRFNVSILEYIPSASLSIKTGMPVMRNESSVVLQLENEDGLQGWNCWVYRNELETKRIKLKLANNSVTVAFQPNKLVAPEELFWCTDSNEQHRSNQQRIRTSDKDTLLELYPLPAVVGESLVLKCLVRGTNLLSRTVFYKDNVIISEGPSATHKITTVTNTTVGRYKCDATYTHKARTKGHPYQEVSDIQDVDVQGPPVRAVLSERISLSCACPDCPSHHSYHWYFKKDAQTWAFIASKQNFLTPSTSGFYACRAVWSNARSFLSHPYLYESKVKSIVIGFVIMMVILCAVAVIIWLQLRRRNSREPIYSDVELKQDERAYQSLTPLSGGENEYDTLQPGPTGLQKQEGNYQPLRRDLKTEGVYHTVEKLGEYEDMARHGLREETGEPSEEGEGAKE